MISDQAMLQMSDALNPTEMQAIGHKGYENVAVNRDAVTKVFTSEEVKRVISSRNIRLMSYKSSALEILKSK